MDYQKIHKSFEIQNVINQQNSSYIQVNSTQDLKFRPIEAGPQCSTHQICNFLNNILKPLCQFGPSYIRDSFGFFFNFLPNEVDTSAF